MHFQSDVIGLEEPEPFLIKEVGRGSAASECYCDAHDAVAGVAVPAPFSQIQPWKGTSHESLGNGALLMQAEGSTTHAGTDLQSGSERSWS